MRKINLIIMIAAVLISVSASAQGVLCTKDSPSGVLYTMKGGKCWSYSCENGKAKYNSEEKSEKCGIGVKCKAGEKRTLPMGGKCEQTCCANGSWSKCNKSCQDKSCGEDECFDGKQCTPKPADYRESKGNCKYRYECKEYACGASGWMCVKGKEKKEVINNNPRVQKGKWTRKDERKGSGTKCSADITKVNETTAAEDCIKHNASISSKTAAEVKKMNITFKGECYIKEANGDYSYLKCWSEQAECK